MEREREIKTSKSLDCKSCGSGSKGKCMSMLLEAESSEMVRPPEEKPWKALGLALTILNCVANTIVT